MSDTASWTFVPAAVADGGMFGEHPKPPIGVDN
jgi:hypothetical protein